MKPFIPFIITALLTLSISLPAYAEGTNKGAGDDFRVTAANYDKQASEAAQEAARADGKEIGIYLEKSSIYREMAKIKRHAAGLADRNRWDDINWDRYMVLESRLEALQRSLK